MFNKLRKEWHMNVELSKEDLILIDMLLSKAEGVTRIEIHHCKHREYKDFLEKRSSTSEIFWRG